MTSELENKETLILLYRLMGFVGRRRLYSHECQTNQVDDRNIYKKEIVSKRAEDPIVLSMPGTCGFIFPSDFRVARSALAELESYSRLGHPPLSNHEWGETILFSSNVLKQYIFVARTLSAALRKLAMYMAEKNGFGSIIEVFRRSALNKFSKPSTARKPFHLHYTSNQAGGGDISNIILRLGFEQGMFMDETSILKSWLVDESVRFHVFERRFINLFRSMEKQSSMQISILSHSMDMADILESFGDEVEDIHEEMVGWVKLPCAMALHGRLGETSMLRSVGVDVMMMISSFL
jgi:hypothetical protein